MTVIDWLLDSDPALRWQVRRDLTDSPPEEVLAERSLVAIRGSGARLLSLHDEDGQWAGGACFPADFDFDFSSGQPWTSTLPTLQLLRDLGVEPNAEPAREAVALVRQNSRWEHAGQLFFEGEVEACINGRTVAIGSYFGADVSRIVNRLLEEQLEDGGWNCEAENGSVRSSFDSTICVLEGLLEYERVSGSTARTMLARQRGEEYLLQRHLFRRLSNGDVVNAAYLEFSFPQWWHYDILRALDYFRSAGNPPDSRLAAAIEMLRSKRESDGTWLLEGTHPGEVHFQLEDGDGQPSRWNTLRALRVLKWFEAGGPG